MQQDAPTEDQRPEESVTQIDRPEEEAAPQLMADTTPAKPHTRSPRHVHDYSEAEELFPTDNHFGIPVLREDKQAQVVPTPFVCWGQRTRNTPMFGTWNFYCEDHKFESLWDRPAAVLKSAPQAAVEVNWSVRDQCPGAVAIWATYKKRWMARYWQERGLPVFVDLCVSPRWSETNLIGVPRGWRAFCTRATAGNLFEVVQDYDLAVKHSGTDIIFIVYGGGMITERMCMREGWRWMADHVSAGRDATRIEQALLGHTLTPLSEGDHLRDAVLKLGPTFQSAFAYSYGLRGIDMSHLPKDPFARAQAVRFAEQRLRATLENVFKADLPEIMGASKPQ